MPYIPVRPGSDFKAPQYGIKKDMVQSFDLLFW